MKVRALVASIGKAGTGKTTKLAELSRPCRRLIVADPEGGWEPERGDVELEGAGSLVARLQQLGAHDRAVAFRLVYRAPADVMALEAAGAALAIRHCTLLVDELAWLCTAQFAPEPLRQVVQFGRPRSINLLFTTREPQEVHNLFLTQANRWYCFRVDPGLGLDRIRKWRGRAFAAQLEGLREYPGPGAPSEFCSWGNPAIEGLLGREGLDFSAGRLLSSRRIAHTRRVR